MIKSGFWVLAAGLALLTLFPSAQAGERDYVAVGGVAGLPEMLGAEARVFASAKLQVGMGYGFFPVNGFLQSKVHLPSYDLGSGVSLSPSATYSMSSISGLIRYFPHPDQRGGGLFYEFIYSHWNGQSNVQGNITALGQTIASNVIDGNMTLTEDLFGLMVGKEYVFGKKPTFFIDLAAGLAYKTQVSISTSLSANGQQIGGLPAPEQTQLNNSLSSIQQQTQNGLSGYNNIPVMPLLLLGFGAKF